MDSRREHLSGQGVQYQAGMGGGPIEDIDKSNSEKIGRWLMNLGTKSSLQPGNERYPANGGKGWDQGHYDVSKMGAPGLHPDGRPEMQRIYGSGELNRLPQFQQDARGVGSPGFQDPNIGAISSNWEKPIPHDLRMGNTANRNMSQRESSVPSFPGFSPDFSGYMRGGHSPYGTPPSISPGALYNQSLPVPALNAWRPTDPMCGNFPPRHQSGSQPRNDLPSMSSFQTGSHASPQEPGMDSGFIAKILPNLITITENIATVDPYITVDQFKDLLERLFGTLSGTEKVTFSSLLEFYRLVRKTQSIPDNVVVVLKTLSQAFLSFAENPVAGSSVHDQPRYRSADLRAEIMQQLPRNGVGMSHSVVGVEGAEARRLREEIEQALLPIPGGKALPITCNGNDGIFRLEDHTCDCYCDVCKLIKSYTGLKELRMSPREFERHCGMGHAKKWKASIRIKEKDKKIYKTLGHAMDRLKIFKSIDGAEDDDLMIKYARPKMKGAKASVTNIEISELEKVAMRMKNKAQRQGTLADTELEIVKQTGDDAGKDKSNPINGIVDEKGEKNSPRGNVCNNHESKESKKEIVQQELQQASKDGAIPEIAAWRITENNYLALNINFGKFTFSGILPNLSCAGGNIVNEKAKQDEVVHDKLPAEQKKVGNDVPQPNSSSGRAKKRKRPTSQPITKNPEEYHKLLISGPLEGTLCVLCGKPEEKSSAADSLGELMLVKLTNVHNAWVHDQCAKWSPDVYDPNGDGLLEGVKDAIRRGRMIRCKHCNEKGATLGCLVETCRSSYHLACARECNCTLRLDPYEVYCPKHIKFSEKYSAKKKSRPKPPADPEAKKKRKSLSPLSKLGDVAASHLTKTD